MRNKYTTSATHASNGTCNPHRINAESTSCVWRYNIGIGTHYAMPIYEYLCADCGSKFEKLVRRSADADSLVCPSCGQKHLQQEYSTFSARANGESKSAEMPSCPSGGRCPTPGMCGMN